MARSIHSEKPPDTPCGISGGQFARVGTRGGETLLVAGVAVENRVVLAIFWCDVALRRRTNHIAVRRDTAPAVFASLILVELPLVFFCCHRSPPFLKVHTLDQIELIKEYANRSARLARIEPCPALTANFTPFARGPFTQHWHERLSGLCCGQGSANVAKPSSQPSSHGDHGRGRAVNYSGGMRSF